jgi:hypothetical protein
MPVLQMNLERNPQLRVRQANVRTAIFGRMMSAAAEPPVARDIPIVVHVLDPDDPDRVTDAQVQSQIDVLNEDFNNRNGDIDQVPVPFKERVGNPELSFHLAEDGIIRKRVAVQTFAADDTMKRDSTGGSDARDPARYLNIWVCPLFDPMLGTLLGYAQFPDGGPVETDGVVIATTAFGRGGIANSPFDLGRTATHEVGHYLGLFHIWGNSLFATCTDDDEVVDTPVQFQRNIDKPTFPSISCSNGPDGDMFMNYMDYVDDDSMFMFTKSQVLRMHSALAESRPQLGVSTTGGTPTAGTSGSKGKASS